MFILVAVLIGGAIFGVAAFFFGDAYELLERRLAQKSPRGSLMSPADVRTVQDYLAPTLLTGLREALREEMKEVHDALKALVAAHKPGAAVGPAPTPSPPPGPISPQPLPTPLQGGVTAAPEAVRRPALIPVLQYAYEWNYRGSTHAVGNWSRPIAESVPLRKKLAAAPHRLDLAVYNAGPAHALDVVERVEFPENIRVRPSGLWRAAGRQNTYDYNFGAIEIGAGLVPDQPLMLEFLDGAGRYVVRYHINAKDTPEISGLFTLILE